MSGLFNFVRILVNVIFRPIFWVKYEGLENFPKKGRVVLCSNHISCLDPVLIMMPIIKRKIRFMAKSELFKRKFFDRFLRWAGAFPVNRGDADTESLRTALQILQDEQPMGIFPEGGCVYESIPFKPKAGAALLASKSKSPVLPVAISCKGRVRPFKPIRVSFGKLISYKELGFFDGTLREARQASRIIANRVNAIMGVRE